MTAKLPLVDPARNGPPGPSRYARHLVLPGFGAAGQERLAKARILVVGLGGLGSPAAQYLAAAGVGTLGLLDHDRVEESNLQRQTLYQSSDVGRSKAEAARTRLAGFNPYIRLVAHPERLTRENALRVLQEYDVVLDASDNFATRYLVNDACALLGKPDVFGSALAYEGQASVFWKGRGACYRCLFPKPPPPGAVPSCSDAGILGAVVGVIGSVQALEAIKIVVGLGEPLLDRLLVYDGLSQGLVTVKLSKDPSCALCGPEPTIRALIDYDAFCGAPTPMTTDPPTTITPIELKQKMDAKEPFLLLDVRQPDEYEAARLPGSVLIPTHEFQAREAELEPHRGKEIVVMCHTGSRSNLVSAYLRRKGFPRVRNLVGGIQRWSEEVDPTVPMY